MEKMQISKNDFLKTTFLSTEELMQFSHSLHQSPKTVQNFKCDLYKKRVWMWSQPSEQTNCKSFHLMSS
jgi:hypothetical protein